MDTIGIVIYCQGFLLPRPYGYSVREMGLCDLSGKNRKVFAYENKGPSYNKLSAEAKKAVDDACKQHGVSYEPKYPARSNCLTVDFDEFVAEFTPKNRPDVGVWAGDVVAQAFLEGLGLTPVLIEHENLQICPLGSVMSDDENHQHRHECCGHRLRQPPEDEDLEETYFHRCCVEFACALAALVRKETHYRSPTLVQDLLYQRNLWQHRMERVLDAVMCSSESSADMGRAFDRGEGLSWYSDCDTGFCRIIRSIFQRGVHCKEDGFWNASDYHDSTLDTLSVLTPFVEKEE